MPDTDCLVCSGAYSVDDANSYVPMCDSHRQQVAMAHVERDLRKVLPVALHDAHPRDLSGSLSAWDGLIGLYLYGPVGTGKSHAAAALAKRWYVHRRKQGLASGLVWLNMPQSILETLTELGKGSSGNPNGVWERAMNAELLVLDNVEGTEKEWVLLRLYGLVEHRVNRGLPMIVTSKYAVAALSQRLTPDIASRLSGCAAQVSFEGKPDRRPGLAPELKA